MISQLSQRARVLLISIPSALVLLCLVAMFFLNHEPPAFNPIGRSSLHAQDHGHQMVTGYTTTATLIETVDVLLHKRGGYMSNDVMPPWVFLDNVPNWEYGALVQIRDLARAMRNDFSRSQTQSTEDPDLAEADPDTVTFEDEVRGVPLAGPLQQPADPLGIVLVHLTPEGAHEVGLTLSRRGTGLASRGHAEQGRFCHQRA